jgi:GT2 family glycosyltransferase
MTEKQPLVSLITINYNSLKVTTEMLDSVRKLSYPNLEVIVIDNASIESPESRLKKEYPEIIFIRSDENIGFSGGNNLGIQVSKGEFLYFINNDTELVEGSIERLVSLFNNVEALGAVSPMIYHHPDLHAQKDKLIQYAGTTLVSSLTARNKTIGAGEIDKGRLNEPYPTAYTHGAAMMVPRSVVQKVGMMPEDFFLYYEEIDWCEQIREAGFQIYVEPRAKIYHKESISVGKMNTIKTYYLTRNRILFIRRHRTGFEIFLFSLFLILFTLPKNLFLYLIKGDGRHARAFIKGIFWHLTSESSTCFNSLPRLIEVVPSSNPKAEIQ